MKAGIYKIIISCLLIIILNSCKKLSDNNIPKEIIGQWEWLFSYKPLPPSDINPLTPENTGINEILVFKTDNTWFKTENDTIVDSGNYSLGHGIRYPFVGSSTYYIYDSVVYYNRDGIDIYDCDYYDVFNDTLLFSHGLTGACGAGTKYYKKLETFR